MTRPLSAAELARAYALNSPDGGAFLPNALRPVANTHPAPEPCAAGKSARVRRPRALMRKCEVAYLATDGTVRETTHLAPATQTFETPFMALARGALVATPHGPTAIEDLEPGTEIATADGNTQKIFWIGATTMVPGAQRQCEAAGQLTRFAAEGMGFQRPSHDLLLGCGARVLRRSHGAPVSAPAAEFADGEAIFTVRPPSPVRVYHLALSRHAAIWANGIEIESFHPARAHQDMARHDMRALYLSLFPHVKKMMEFGPLAFPRADDGHPSADFA